MARHEGFGRGEVDTGLIDRDLGLLAVDPVACSRSRALAAIGAMGLDKGEASGFTLWAPLDQTAEFDYRGERLAARVTTLGGGDFKVSIDGVDHGLSRAFAKWRVDGSPVEAEIVRTATQVMVFWGNGYAFDLVDPLDRGTHDAASAGVVEAPMPGLVKAVFVSRGAEVQRGDRLALLEAMKMEHTLTAGRDGVVAEVLASEGLQVEAGAALIRLEEETP